MTSLNYDGIISGTLDTVYVGNDVTATGGGNASTIFNATNTYSAATVFNSNVAASLKLGVDNALPVTTTLYFNKGNGGLNTNGFNQKVASIADGANTGTPGGIALSSTKVFSIEGTVSNTYGGVISGAGALTLTSSNTGTQTLTGANTYTGGTNINGGTLSLGASNVLADAGAVNVNGGVLNTAGAFTDSIGALTLTSGSITGSTGTLNPTSISVSSGTIDAIIGGGAAAMTKNTSGTVFLTNASNTYAGGTTINGGILSVNGPNRLGSTAVGLTINAGTFQLTTTSIGSDRSIAFGNANSTFDIASGITYTNYNASGTALFSGSGKLNKTGAGTLTFSSSNNTPHTYSGGLKYYSRSCYNK
jgi:autotransporter-associated beta strand protein